MNAKRILTIFSLLLFLINILNAQKDFLDYGKVSLEEMNMTTCSFDSNASAIVLGDFGTARFRFTDQDGFLIDFTRHLRIKIIDKEAFEQANFTIYLDKARSGREERVVGIKGITYNLVAGEIEKVKLSKENMFEDNVNVKFKLLKVSMPAIQEGSIIELSYTIQSPFLFNLPGWVFQGEIPTLRSEYHVFMPEYFNYKNWIEGYEYVQKLEERKTETYTYIAEAEITSSGRQSGGTRAFDATVFHWTYIGENIKAFKDEPYITQSSDYFTAVRFELLSVKFPWATAEYYTTTWKDINTRLNDDEDFGLTLKRDMHLNDIGQTIALETDPLQRAFLAYNHIKKQINWDGDYGLFTDGTIRNAYVEKDGNSAEINLNLVALCRKAGLTAYPVIISTRKHGRVRIGQAILSQFNHVIAAVIINEKTLLLDATDIHCPFTLLPPQDLNDQGRLIDENEGRWVNLYNTIPYDNVYLLNLKLGENMQWSGEFTSKATDYAGVSLRKQFRSFNSQEEFMKEFEKDLGGFELSEYKIQDIDSISKPAIITAKITIPEPVQVFGDLIFLTPKLIQRMVTNIFKYETRQYPIDFNYPVKERVMITFEIPAGYAIEELPKQISAALPENRGKYLFSVKNAGNQIQLICNFQVNQTIFPSENYLELKSFYDLIVAKEAEQIVLKKIQ